MTLDDIIPLKIFEVIAGSRAYGTNTPDSDTDIRGIFAMPASSHVSIIPPPLQVSDEKQDITFFELKRYIKLASDCNPNIIELLWTPEDCIRHITPAMQTLIDNRDLFISKKAYHTFSGYAYSQIKRAKGRNKWVNNPKPKEPPKKADFCWIVPVSRLHGSACPDSPPKGYPLILGQADNPVGRMPFRPRPLSEFMFSFKSLKNYHVAKMEHMENTYRLYEYTMPIGHNGYCGPECRGVFQGRGINSNLKVESIPKEDEWTRFAGLLIFNEPAYKSAYSDWKNYHEWLKNRNEARYRTMEAGEIDYDAKNVMHCMRLLWSGEHILNHGTPIVRFEGERRQMLLDIRNGKFAYEDILEIIESKKAELDTLREGSTIPNKVNLKKIDALYQGML